MKPDPCRCDAYAFPHREYGGKCDGHPDRQNNDDADRWLSGMMRRGARRLMSEDERLDDPRHVPYNNLGRR